MYLINQRIILMVKASVLLGIPLLSSFVVPWFSNWKIPAIGLILIGYFLNNIYPDRIDFGVDGKMRIKVFLFPDWMVYELSQVEMTQGKHCIYLYIDGKRKYRISMEKLSLRLYHQLTGLVPLRKTSEKTDK